MKQIRIVFLHGKIWWEWSKSRSVVSNSLRPHGLCSPWNSPDGYTEVGIQRSSLLPPGFSMYICLRVLSCVWLCDLLDYSPAGSSLCRILQARILEWVAIPFSRGSSWPRDQTQVLRISGRFFTVWATREAPPQFHLFSSAQLVAQSCLTLCDPMTAICHASLSITNSRSLLELMSIELVMPFSHLILCQPLLLLPSIYPSIKFFSNVSAPCIRWPKYWSFSWCSLNICWINEWRHK